MKVLSINEQPDGSALADIETSEAENSRLVEFAVVELLKRSIERDKMKQITFEVDTSLWMEDTGSICSSIYVQRMDEAVANEATTLTGLLNGLIESHCIPSKPPKIRQVDRARLLGLCSSLKKEIEQAEELIRDIKKWKK